MVELDEITKPGEERTAISIRRFAVSILTCILCTALVGGAINKLAQGLLHAETGGPTDQNVKLCSLCSLLWQGMRLDIPSTLGTPEV